MHILKAYLVFSFGGECPRLDDFVCCVSDEDSPALSHNAVSTLIVRVRVGGEENHTVRGNNRLWGNRTVLFLTCYLLEN